MITRLFWVIYIAAVIAIGWALLARAEAAERWDPVARNCAATIIHQQCPRGGTCGDTWPAWAKCTIATVWGPQAAATPLVAGCIDKIWQYRWVHRSQICAMCGDPVDDAIHCAGLR